MAISEYNEQKLDITGNMEKFLRLEYADGTKRVIKHGHMYFFDIHAVTNTADSKILEPLTIRINYYDIPSRSDKEELVISGTTAYSEELSYDECKQLIADFTTGLKHFGDEPEYQYNTKQHRASFFNNNIPEDGCEPVEYSFGVGKNELEAMQELIRHFEQVL